MSLARFREAAVDPHGARGYRADVLFQPPEALQDEFKGYKITPMAQVSKWALIAAGLGLLGGLLGSLYPALPAARMDPGAGFELRMIASNASCDT